MGSNSFAKTIMGSPFRWNGLADPGREAYNKTLIADAPVMTIQPGIPQLRKNEVEFDDTEDADGGFSFIQNLLSFLSTSRDKLDERMYVFKDATNEYIHYLNVSLGALGQMMGVSDGLQGISSLIETDGKGYKYLKFYCDKNLSLSESVTNDFGASELSGKYKELSDKVKEAQFLAGAQSGSDKISLASKVTNLVDKLTSGKIFDDLLTGVQADNSVSIDELKAIANRGGGLALPDTWKDSSTTRSFSATINLVSPYGSPDCVWRYIYGPFLILFNLAMPRQLGSDGFKSPFLVRVDIPGYYYSDLAVISSMTWNKAALDGLYNPNGLPLSMTIQLEIKDLYQTMFISGNDKQFKRNTGLHSYLDNMAGINVEDKNLINYTQKRIAAKLSGLTSLKDEAWNTLNGFGDALKKGETGLGALDFGSDLAQKIGGAISMFK